MTPAHETPKPPLLHRAAAGTLTVLSTFQVLLGIFYVIDLDPDALTAQLQHASSTQVGTWAVIAALSAFGTFRAVGYIIRAGLGGWIGYRSPVEPVLASLALGLLCMVVVTGDVLVWGSFALLTAMVSSACSEALRAPKPAA
ncbi:hypothetical protein [Arthrobacter caoxuetaonis]|uniref:Uncharacterized protein n=1 Tax=Arthrobacter caoxuetaonis TaxID=2886935 RepID=A0A9X1MI87_9MICC|nr:hypothetical protein [Arthrobacter caoxuetaonis]MCC3299807.1 hypothetical protein [Arthrobacter caoxuetaonis]USQ59293.1 hypothetical protein NF551_17055 [Arthrobacter caoxuetaonis]